MNPEYGGWLPADDKMANSPGRQELIARGRYAERSALAGHLNRLREHANAGPDYLTALDDVAAQVGLTREEKVTYRA